MEDSGAAVTTVEASLRAVVGWSGLEKHQSFSGDRTRLRFRGFRARNKSLAVERQLI